MRTKRNQGRNSNKLKGKKSTLGLDSKLTDHIRCKYWIKTDKYYFLVIRFFEKKELQC